MSGYGAGTELIGQAWQSFGTAIGDWATAHGEEQAASLFGEAAQIAGQSATEEQAVGKLQQVQTARQVMLTSSSATAAAAAGGLRIGGSAAAILRSNASQGAFANQLIAENTGINVNSYLQQQTAAQAEQTQALTAAKAEGIAAEGASIGAIHDVIAGALDIGFAAASPGGGTGG